MKEKTIPPYTIEQVHALVGGNRMSQFQFRRRCDRYLLDLCLAVIAHKCFLIIIHRHLHT